ncbi:transposable element Tcb1 transposase [Trichonephila clavipes]|nr:transposable element Tcb1 transposase [Trichonephila clavipes]
MSRFSLSSDRDLARVVLLIVQKISGKGPISDMRYHGVGWHHDQWPHAPTCGCAEWTTTGQRYIDEVLLPHVRLFRGAVGDKFVFLWTTTQHVIETLAVQDCLDSEGIQRLSYGRARPLDLNPIENVWDALGGKLLVETILRQTRTPSSVHSQRWDKLPQQLLDNVVQSMVRRVEYCITLHGGHIPY